MYMKIDERFKFYYESNLHEVSFERTAKLLKFLTLEDNDCLSILAMPVTRKLARKLYDNLIEYQYSNPDWKETLVTRASLNIINQHANEMGL